MESSRTGYFEAEDIQMSRVFCRVSRKGTRVPRRPAVLPVLNIYPVSHCSDICHGVYSGDVYLLSEFLLKNQIMIEWLSKNHHG